MAAGGEFEREMQDTYSDLTAGLSEIEELAGGAAPVLEAVARLRATTDRHFDRLGSLYFEALMS